MAEKQSADGDGSIWTDASSGAQQAASVEQGGKSSQDEPPSTPPAQHRPSRKRTLLLGVLAALGLAAICIYGIPRVQLALNTVSTDDAYVNGHVTFVAPRVRGQVARVLVDDNNRVRKGDLLAQLDKEPFQDAVAERTAAVDIAAADLHAAKANMRGVEAQARSLRWKLQYAMENVDNQVALLHARVAALDKTKATLKLAQLDFARAEKLVRDGTISQQEFDRQQASLSVAQAEVVQAMSDVHQVRVSLGLPPQPESGNLGEAPPRSRSNLRFRPGGAGRPDRDGGATRRCPLVRTTAETDGRAVRETRSRRC